MTLVSSIVILSFYFTNRLSLAAGISFCGSGVGTFVFANMANELLSEYTWKGTVLIEAGIMLNCIFCGMTFWPMHFKKTLDEVECVVEPICTAEAVIDMRSMPVDSEGMNRLGNRSASTPDLRQTSDTVTRWPSTRWPSTRSYNAFNFNLNPSPNPNPHQRWPSTQMLSPMLRSQVLCHSIEHVAQLQTVRDDYTGNKMSLDGQPEPHGTLDKANTKKKVSQTLTKMLDFRLFLNVVFVLFAFSNFLTGLGYIVPYIFLPNRGLQLGFTSDQSSWLISVLGISNTIGRFAIGLIANLRNVNRLILFNAVRIICGICSLLSVLFWTFPLQMCYSFVFGFLIGL